jgi:TonB family protein
LSTGYLLPGDSGIPTFAPLGGQPGRWRSFITGFGLQAALVFAATTLTITAAPQLIQHTYEHIELAPAPSVDPRPYKPVRTLPPPVAKIVVPPKAQLERFAPAPVAPTAIVVRTDPKPILAETVVKLPQAPAPKFDSPATDKPAGPKAARALATSGFAGSSATPTLKNTPAHEVQTGGFGDPNGVPSNERSSGSGNIAKLGSFDLPNGGGQGNGSGGTRGARGTVASAGFGNGIATEGGAGGRGTGVQGRVQTTAFAAAAPPPASEAAKKKVAVEAPTTPVSINSKPNPVYTDEARKLHIEGEVLVQVVFTATGQVRVLHIVRALGHGLDDAAVRAAEGIRFTPAQRSGQPVDSTATLHIVFQLS